MGKRSRVAIAFLCTIITNQLGQASGLEINDSHSEKPIRIAVAANFKPVLDELIDHYYLDHEITVSTGSTGALTTQIINGAPYDLLFAADAKRPEYLENIGLTRARKTYAYGRLAFWQPEANRVTEANLTEMSVAIAIANPRHAPYGYAAEEVLHKAGKTNLKRIKGNNVAQAFSFVQTGNVKAGLVALSQLRFRAATDHTYWIIPANYHQPIEQQAVVIRGADDRAESFLQYIDSATARKVIRQAGYDLAGNHD